jgi:transcriptional regulator
MDALSDTYVEGMMRGIVAFEVPLDRLEGKSKLSQNRPAADQARVRAALRAEGDPMATAVAELMERRAGSGDADAPRGRHGD